MRAIVQGNWFAAGATALSALIIAWGTSVALVFLAVPRSRHPTASTRRVLAQPQLRRVRQPSLGTIGAAASFGVDGVIEIVAEGDDAGDSTFGVVPLVVSTASLGIAILVFRRLTRGNPRLLQVLSDAACASLVFVVLLLGTTLGFAIHITEDDNESTKWDMGVFHSAAFFMGFAAMFVALALACLARRWDSPPWRVHDYVAAPIRGVAMFILLLPLAGVISTVAYALSVGDDQDPSRRRTMKTLMVTASHRESFRR